MFKVTRINTSLPFLKIPLYLIKLISDTDQNMQIILNLGGTNFKIIFKNNISKKIFSKKPFAPKLDL